MLLLKGKIMLYDVLVGTQPLMGGTEFKITSKTIETKRKVNNKMLGTHLKLSLCS